MLIMLPKYTAALFCLCAVSTARFCQKSIEWRYYDGTIPEDAIVKLHDVKGDPVYIAQVPFAGRIMLAAIYKREPNKAYFFDDGKKKSTSENIQILCGNYPNSFEWASTSSDRLPAYRSSNYLIPGGEEDYEETYIGKTTGAKPELGKVVIGESAANTKMYVVDNGERAYTEFNVLTYNDWQCEGY